MATQTKFNPVLPNEARHFNGKSITAVRITLGADMTDEFGPNGALQRVYEVIQANATPIIYGHVENLGTGQFDVFLEGDFTEYDDYGSGGTDDYVTDLENRIQALGSTVAVRGASLETVVAGIETQSAGVDLSGATVADIAELAAREDGNVGLVGDGGVTITP